MLQQAAVIRDAWLHLLVSACDEEVIFLHHA